MEKDTWSYKIENINHILIGMVVCLHCSLYNYLSGNKASEYYINSALRFLNVIFDAAVPTFFVISAYLYYKNFTTKKYISKLKSRVFSLVIPYFLWSTIMYVYYALITVLISGASVTIESSVELSWKGAFISILTAKSALTMWFVRVLVVFAVISPIFYVLIKIFKKKIEQVLCFVFLVFFTIILKEQYSHAFYWIPCHYLGGVLAVYYDRFDIVPKQVWNKTVVYIATTLLAFMAFASNNDSSVWYSLYRYIVPIAVLSILNTDILDKKLFNNVSPFFVFAIHIPVLQVVRTILIYLMGEVTSINIIPIYILIIIVTYIVIWCITKVSIRFINPFYKLLIGGRIS